MKISIVETYYNRPQQLQLGLTSLLPYIKGREDIEIIIVDDGSDVRVNAHLVAEKFAEELNIRVLYIPPRKKTWISPVIPYNRGFAMATGEIVVIQNSESIHHGNLIKYVENNVSEQIYLSFSCYATSEAQHAGFAEVLVRGENGLLAHLVDVTKNLKNVANLREDCWYNHPTLAPHGYHFCSAITKTNLDRIGGFNEAFANGYCFDDNEFVWRIQQNNIMLQVVQPEHGIVIHQWHSKNPNIRGGCKLWEDNRRLWLNIKRGPIFKKG